jgi:16S rRNA (guanine527-N7)-methyltransferase
MSWQTDFTHDYSLDAAQVASFETLLQMLVDRSDRNLTAVTAPHRIVDVHFRDSIALLDFPEVSRASNAVDIGSGAGFPGLPVAIAKPSLQVTLLESNRTKCSFLQEVVDSIGLGNVRLLPSRAEDAARTELRDYFDVAFARAVGPLPVTLEYSLPLVRTGGFAVLQRGELHDADKAKAGDVAARLHASLDRIVPALTYAEAKNLHVWFFQKTDATPDKFPRKAGIAKKRPLG